jgi:hypothetical protein
VSAEPLTETVEPFTETTSPRSRLAGILLGSLAGLVILVLVWFLWLAPAGNDAEPAAAEGEPAVAAGDEVLAQPVTGDDELLEPLPAVTHDVYLARDPFEPVVEEEEPAQESSEGATSEGGTPDDATSDGATPVAAPVDGEPVVVGTEPLPVAEPLPGDGGAPAEGEPLPDADGFVVPTDGTASGTCTGQEELVCDGRVVTLDSITMRNGERVATIQVGTDVYEVARGEVFASTFRVVEFSSDSAVMLQYGELIYELTAAHRSMK